MKLSDLDDADKIVTKDYLEVVLGRLENKLMERFNALEAKINGFDGRLNNQRTLVIVAIVGIIAQIINAWILRK
jgi:hypothetical protein